MELSLDKSTEILKEISMKRVLGLIFSIMLLMQLAGLAKPAAAMPEADARAIVEAAYQAVQNSLNALESANGSGDTQKIELALQALDLSVKNYAVASENLARMAAGETVNDAALTTCNLVADKLGIYNARFLQNDLAGAQASFTEARILGETLPLPAGDDIPAGLAEFKSRIIAASSLAVTNLRAAEGIDGGSGPGKLGTNTKVGSPI